MRVLLGSQRAARVSDAQWTMNTFVTLRRRATKSLNFSSCFHNIFVFIPLYFIGIINVILFSLGVRLLKNMGVNLSWDVVLTTFTRSYLSDSKKSGYYSQLISCGYARPLLRHLYYRFCTYLYNMFLINSLLLHAYVLSLSTSYFAWLCRLSFCFSIYLLIYDSIP